jgi:hypothetical protein
VRHGIVGVQKAIRRGPVISMIAGVKRGAQRQLTQPAAARPADSAKTSLVKRRQKEREQHRHNERDEEQLDERKRGKAGRAMRYEPRSRGGKFEARKQKSAGRGAGERPTEREGGEEEDANCHVSCFR